MAPRTIYANLADGLQPFSLWDASLADMGSLGIIPCVAAGANTIALTPVVNAFAPAPAYANKNQFSFTAAANSTGAITVNVGSLGALPLYRPDAVTQAGSNDLIVNIFYVIAFNPALNGGNGGFQQLTWSPSNLAGATRIITAAGDVTVGTGDALIIMNKTVSQNTNVNLPAAASKIGTVKIVDWKGDSESFPITVLPNGAETFNDGQTRWPLQGAGSSATFNPISGLGYAV